MTDIVFDSLRASQLGFFLVLVHPDGRAEFTTNLDEEDVERIKLAFSQVNQVSQLM